MAKWKRTAYFWFGSYRSPSYHIPLHVLGGCFPGYPRTRASYQLGWWYRSEEQPRDLYKALQNSGETRNGNAPSPLLYNCRYQEIRGIYSDIHREALLLPKNYDVSSRDNLRMAVPLFIKRLQLVTEKCREVWHLFWWFTRVVYVCDGYVTLKSGMIHTDAERANVRYYYRLRSKARAQF